MLLLASGCGQQGSSSSSAPTPSPSASGCAGADASTLLSADLDGDGTAEPVRLASADGSCPAALLAMGTSLRLEGALTPGSARVVRVPGRDGALVAVREVHPRGGYQVHLYGYADGKLGEVVDSGQPVVPFVATDTKGSYVSVSCADRALVVREAVAHDPPGVAFAWDVRDTPFRLDGLRATAGKPREVADNVLPDQLAARFPAVAQRQMFRSGCR